MNSGRTLEEIKRLFNYLEENKTNDNLQIIITTEGCNDLYKLFIDFNKYQKILEERVDKAIEYIDNTNLQLPLEYGDKTAMFKRHLRTILKGEENDKN